MDRSAAPNLIGLSPAALRVLAVCRAAGARPLIVGGSVRDALLGRDAGRPAAATDVDVELHDVHDLGRLVDVLGLIGRVAVRGAAFDVVAVQVDGEGFDLSVAPGGLAPGEVRDAFALRDFTINAMGWDPITDELIDPFGGRADLDAGLLRHTSDRFADDPLRVLRGVRFAGVFGFRFAAETRGLCRSLSPRGAELPVERVWAEWRRLARGATHWPEALEALHESGWDTRFPELRATRGVRQDPGWHSEGDVWTHLGLAAQSAAVFAERDGLNGDDREVAVLGALVHDFGKVTHTQVTSARISSHGHAEAGAAPAESFLQRIGAPRHLIDRILPLVREHMAPVSVRGTPSRAAVRRLVRRLSPDGHGATIQDWARVVDADCAGRGASAKPSPAGAWLAVAERIGAA